jgi:hypothetical protein
MREIVPNLATVSQLHPSLDNSTEQVEQAGVRERKLTGNEQVLSPVSVVGLGSLREKKRDAWLDAWKDESWGEEGSRCGSETAEKEEGGVKRVVPMLCGMWSCKVCGRVKYKWFTRNVRGAAREHGLRFFWTLTIAHGSCTPAESWDLVVRAWAKFRAEMAREGRPLTFIWVLEPQKSGHAHIHVLWNRWVAHSEVSRRWAVATGGSYVVHYEHVRNDNAAHYLAKYLSKLSAGVIEVPGLGEMSKRHRFGKSQNITFSPFRHKSEGWERQAVSYKDSVRAFKRQGLILEAKEEGVPRFSAQLGYAGPKRFEVRRYALSLLEGQEVDVGRLMVDPAAEQWVAKWKASWDGRYQFREDGRL